MFVNYVDWMTTQEGVIPAEREKGLICNSIPGMATEIKC